MQHHGESKHKDFIKISLFNTFSDISFRLTFGGGNQDKYIDNLSLFDEVVSCVTKNVEKTTTLRNTICKSNTYINVHRFILGHNLAVGKMKHNMYSR